MPWHPWHWAILFSMGVWLPSAAIAEPAKDKRTAIAIREGDMGAGVVLLEFGRPELYLSVLLEERFPGARRRKMEALPQQDADLDELAGDFLALDVLRD